MPNEKSPKLVFEYDCMCWFGNSFNLKLYEDGRLIRLNYGYSKLGPEDRLTDDVEYQVINSPDLAKAIKQLIKENKEELKNLSKDISNPSICDGAGEMKFEGSNNLTVSMEGYKENFKKYNYPVLGWEEELLQFQRLFKKFQNKFHEYVDEPLFNGEGEED